MAEIIVLAKWREKHSGRAAARSSVQTMQAAAGEILIYTGVRYERHEPVEARPVDMIAVRAES